MPIRFLVCVWIVGIVQAQSPCRVNVIFSLEASTYVKSEGESIVYDQISKVQSVYQSWSISPNSVRATLPKPIGCNQGGNSNLQNDTNSLNNVVSGVKRFLYTCFQQNSLSDYITFLNNQILQSQAVDPANYVFIIFTATTDTNDVQQAINLRAQFFDPKGYGLIVVKVEPQTASNLAQLATYGIYDLGDPIFTQDITSAACGKIQTLPTKTPVITPQSGTTEKPQHRTTEEPQHRTTEEPQPRTTEEPQPKTTEKHHLTTLLLYSTEPMELTTIFPFKHSTDYYDHLTTPQPIYDIDDDLQELEKKIHELRAHRQARKQKPKSRKINGKNLLTNKVSHKKVAPKKQNNKIAKHTKLQTHSKTRVAQNKTMVKNLHKKV